MLLGYRAIAALVLAILPAACAAASCAREIAPSRPAEPRPWLTPSASVSSNSAPTGNGFNTVCACQGHTCATTDAGELFCWGASYSGQGRPRRVERPERVEGISEASQVRCHSSTTCVRTKKGEVYCRDWYWPTWVMVEGLQDALDVMPHIGHSCAIRANGAAQCWGGVYQGRLVPMPSAAFDAERFVPTFGTFSPFCVLSRERRPSCFWPGQAAPSKIPGKGASAALSGSAVPLAPPVSSSPTSIGPWPQAAAPLLQTAPLTDLVLWPEGTCVLHNDGKVECTEPKVLEALRKVVGTEGVEKFLALAPGILCLRRRDRSTRCAKFGDSPLARLTPDLGPVRSLDFGHKHACAVTEDGALQCWGSDASGELGDAPRFERTTPGAVGISDATDIAVADSYSCALRTGGKVSCWGTAEPGGCPDLASMAPQDLAIPWRVARITMNSTDYSVGLCASDDHGAWACRRDKWAPQPMPRSPVRQFAAGVLLSEDGVVRWWNAMTEPPVLENWGYSEKGLRMELLSYDARCAADARGHLACLGAQGGFSEVLYAPSKSQFVEITTLLSPYEKNQSVCGRTKDGRVECFRFLEAGQGGTGQLLRTMEEATSGLREIVGIAGDGGAGSLPRVVCALKKQGTVLCWGSNEEGQLGDGTRTSREVPKPVVGLPAVRRIAVSASHVCALTAQGEVYCWGDNRCGAVAHGESPVRVAPAFHPPVVGATQ